MKPESWEWEPLCNHDRACEDVYGDLLRARLAQDARSAGAWKPEVAPLCDLALVPIATWSGWEGLTGHAVDRPAPGRDGSIILARGTTLAFVDGRGDPYHEMDLLEYRVTSGPLADETIWFGEGRTSWGMLIAQMLLARPDEPIFADSSAGPRLLADLRRIRDMDPGQRRAALGVRSE